MIALASRALATNGVLSRVIQRHAWLVSLVLLHAMAAVAAADMLGLSFDPGVVSRLSTIFTILVPVFLLVLFIWRTVCAARTVREGSVTLWLLRDVRDIFTDGERMLNGAIALLALSLFMGAFDFFKMVIPQINPFSWDPLFARTDQILHGGQDPYTLLMPLFGTPLATTIINGAYNVWFLLMFFVVFVACFTRHNPRARDTFLLAFVLTWAIGGNLLATVFSSGGPVYFAPLGFGDHFQPLVSMLHAFDNVSPVWSLDVQDALWQGYVADGPLHGISAMPSMHVASTSLLTIYAYRYARWAGILMTIFLCMILVGSVLLAWHYAIDGYAGILVALCCWWAASKLTTPRGDEN
ncbi:MAG: phosphatase PAP2 family protein [Paracoccaceae bacterium]